MDPNQQSDQASRESQPGAELGELIIDHSPPPQNDIPRAPYTPAVPQQNVPEYAPPQPELPAQYVPPPVYNSVPPPPQAAPAPYQAQPYLLPSSSMSGARKLSILIAVVFVLIGVVITTAVAFKKDTNDSAATSSQVSDVIDRNDGTLDLSALISRNETIKTQELTGKLKQQLNLSDGKSYMITAIERNFVSPVTTFKPADGKEFVKVTVVFGNRNKEESILVAPSAFELLNSATTLYKPKTVTDIDLPSVFKQDTLASGKQIKGDIIFEVTKDDKLLSIVTDDKYKNNATNEDIRVSSKISIDNLTTQ